MQYLSTLVLNYFRRDWSDALEAVRTPYVGWIAQVVFSTGFIAAPFLPLLQFHKPQVLFLWSASAAYVFALVIFHFRAPLIFSEYRDYAGYHARKHAHRWIIWYLQKHLPVFESPQEVMKETLEKGFSLLARDCEVGCCIYRVCPIFSEPLGTQFEVFPPVILNDDIYLPFHFKGRRCVLPVQESDPHRDDRQRQLFWIIFSDCAEARILARLLFWAFYALAVVCLTVSLCLVLYAAFTSPPELQLEV
jgi:hypothetical protein